MVIMLSILFYFRGSTRPVAGGGKQSRPRPAPPVVEYPAPAVAPFDDSLRRHVAPAADSYFYTRVTDLAPVPTGGTRRSPVIDRCRPMEMLHLELELGCQFNPGTIAVTRADGSPIGHLDRQASTRLHNDLGKSKQWYAVFKQASHHPKTGELICEPLFLAMAPFPTARNMCS
jgi:hypothetical protein